ncbi:alpha-L-rhamnosidase [Lacticaseibacillus sp. GG6-2]
MIEDLRVNGAINPINIDCHGQIKFSWDFTQCPPAIQKSYQLLLSDQAGNQIWDSGVVNTQETLNIDYTGEALNPSENYRLNLECEMSDGLKVVSHSDFRTALGESDWGKSQWIHTWVQTDNDLVNMERAKWITAQNNQNRDCYIYYQKRITIDFKIEKAILLVVSPDLTKINLNHGHSYFAHHIGQVTNIDISNDLIIGENVFDFRSIDEHLKGVNASRSLCAKIVLIGAEGTHTEIISDHSWLANIESEAPSPARELAQFEDYPWGNISHLPEFAITDIAKRAIYYEREVKINHSLCAAYLHATACGVYELQIDGAPITDTSVNPGYTDYHQGISYQTFDISQFCVGKSAIIVKAIVGDGWYSGNVAMMGPFQYGTHNKFCAQLELIFDDGSHQIVTTDKQWKYYFGPVLGNDLLLGTEYDARISEDGLRRPVATSPMKERLLPQLEPLPRVMQVLEVKQIQALGDDYIVDFGQNFSGVYELKVPETLIAGTMVRLAFGEALDKGDLYQENLRNAKQQDYSITSGKPFSYIPKFTIHGFRFMRVSGFQAPLKPEMIKGLVIYSSMRQTGAINTNNALVNQLFSNINWGQKGNFLSVPTDCPQRDERVGWTADAQVFSETASYNMDTQTFYLKYIRDMILAQHSDGAVPDVAPAVGFFGAGTPAWADAMVILPYVLYRQYNNRDALRQAYPSIKRWLAYCEKNSDGLIRPNEGFGDWLSVGEEAPKDVIATLYFYHSVVLTKEIAMLLGEQEDAQRYAQLAKRIQAAFIERFVSGDGKVSGDTQAGYTLSLAFEILTGEMARKGIKWLVANLNRHQNHLTTGFLSAKFLLPVLCKFGYTKLAYDILLNTSYPSWGYTIKMGATTIWERWDGYTAEAGFEDPRMNSFNHYSLGSVGQWMYEYMVGIKPDIEKPGFCKVRLRPYIDDRVSSVEASYKSISGKISVKYVVSSKTVAYQVILPANVSAELILEGKHYSLNSGTFKIDVQRT